MTKINEKKKQQKVVNIASFVKLKTALQPFFKYCLKFWQKKKIKFIFGNSKDKEGGK